MSRYSVDLDQLIEFADRLRAFNSRAASIAEAVDAEIASLHTSWQGVGAESQTEYHRTWLRLCEELRESADSLRESAALAHRNYIHAAETNCRMWP